MTFTIVLCALRDICKRNGQDDIATDVERYLINQGMDADNESKYKIVPSERDKSSFARLIDGERKPSFAGPIDDNIISSVRVFEAYDYFSKEIGEFISRDMERIETLFYTIINSFRFVRILIDETDKPEKIFECLNFRGKELYEFDLLRNNLIFLKSCLISVFVKFLLGLVHENAP